MNASVTINSFFAQHDPMFSFCYRQQLNHQFQFLVRWGRGHVVLVGYCGFHFGLGRMRRWFVCACCFRWLLTSCFFQCWNWLHTHMAIHSINYYRAYSSKINFPIVPHYTWPFSFATSLIFFHFPQWFSKTLIFSYFY